MRLDSCACLVDSSASFRELRVEHSRTGRSLARSHCDVACSERITDTTNASRSRSLFGERMAGFVAGVRRTGCVRTRWTYTTGTVLCLQVPKTCPVRTVANYVPRVSRIMIRLADGASSRTSSLMLVLPGVTHWTMHPFRTGVRTLCNVYNVRVVASAPETTHYARIRPLSVPCATGLLSCTAHAPVWIIRALTLLYRSRTERSPDIQRSYRPD
jgi:hypothetical protein